MEYARLSRIHPIIHYIARFYVICAVRRNARRTHGNRIAFFSALQFTRNVFASEFPLASNEISGTAHPSALPRAIISRFVLYYDSSLRHLFISNFCAEKYGRLRYSCNISTQFRRKKYHEIKEREPEFFRFLSARARPRRGRELK